MEIDQLKDLLHRATAAANAEIADTLPLAREADEEAERRGHVASLPKGGVLNAAGRKAWDIADFEFLNDTCPDTVNPSLWRMAQLNAISGLFKVADGVWQARACDYANMTVIRGETGWILIDPLMTRQTAAAALEDADATLTLTQAMLEELAAGSLSLDEAVANGMIIVGDPDAVALYFALHDHFDLWFPIVTP